MLYRIKIPYGIPSPPRNISAVPGNKVVHLTWEPPVSDGNGNITEYRVYRGIASGSEALYATVNASTLNFTDTNVSNGVTYYYYVTAVNEFGESEPSNEVSAVPCAVPSPPRNLTAIAGNASVALSWEPPADDGGMAVTNYTIYYGTNSGNYTMNMIVGNLTGYTITGLTNGQRYYFAVSAINEVGESEKSNEFSAVPCTLPSAPKNLTAVAGNRNVTLTWEPPADNGGAAVTNYTIYYGTSSGNYTNNITVGNITSYTITGLINGQRYYFAVSAFNAVGESEKSNEVSAVPCTVPSAPQNLTAVAGNGNVTLTWEPPADNGGMPITGYRIYYGTSAGNYTVNITVGNVTAYTITNLTNGQKYYFSVSAINGGGEGAKSNEVSAIPRAEPNPTPGFDVIAYIYAGVVCASIIILARKKKR
jgi:predicted phage tail protein